MTLAEIKIACLKLLKASYANLVAENIADYYEDSNLNEYLYQMPESINRCFDRFLMDNVAPKAVVEIDDEVYDVTVDDKNIYMTMNMTQIADYYRIDRVIYINPSIVYHVDFDYIMEEDNLILAYQNGYGTYKVVYVKKMPYLTSTSADDDEIDLPGELLRLVPYFVKSDLFEEDEPNLAAAARNIFEASLASIKQKSTIRQTVIKSVYNMSDD